MAKLVRGRGSFKRVKGVEPSSRAWQARVITVIRHPLRRYSSQRSCSLRAAPQRKLFRRYSSQGNCSLRAAPQRKLFHFASLTVNYFIYFEL